MRHILLPTDFSNNAKHAVTYALQLFSEDVCHFYLLHSYAPMVDNMEFMEIGGTEFNAKEAAKTASNTGLKNLIEEIQTSFKNPNHTFSTISASHSLTKEVRELVESKNIDYVIMGTKGATGSKEVFFGSHTVHVFKNATCPVLAIPTTAKYNIISNILFPTDYEIEYEDKNLQPLSNMSKKLNAKVHVLHVSFGDELSPVQKKHQSQLQTYFTNTTHDFHDVPHDDVSMAIVDFQKNNSVDLLAMINNKHTFFENLFFKSRIDQIGFHIGIPFLVLPS